MHHFHIESLEGVEYVLPNARPEAVLEEHETVSGKKGVMCFVRGRLDGKPYQGIFDLGLPQVDGGVWRFLDETGEQVVGTRIDTTDISATRRSVDEVMRILSQLGKTRRKRRAMRDALPERGIRKAWVGSRAHARLYAARILKGKPYKDLIASLRDLLLSSVAEAVAAYDAGGAAKNASGSESGVMSLSPELAYESYMPHAQRYFAWPRPLPPHFDGNVANSYEDEVPYLTPLGKGGEGAKSHLLERQALASGLATLRFNRSAFIATDAHGIKMAFRGSRSGISSGVAFGLCAHKEATRIHFRRLGLPSPRGRMFPRGAYEPAMAYAEQIGFPVVCKPVLGVRGIGVVANIQNKEELARAFRIYESSQLGNDDFIIEKHVNGRDYRIVIIDDEVVAAVQREPASVVGDGLRTVGELIHQKNDYRKRNPHLIHRLIKFDDSTRFQLERRGLTFASVPHDGQRVILANSCNLSQGGDSIEVLDVIHPSLLETARQAVRAIPGLRYCGVDLLIQDHRLPIDQQEAGICELNAHAAIGSAEYPMFGPHRGVAAAFIRHAAAIHGAEIKAEPSTDLCLKLQVRGQVVGVGYRRWFWHLADEFGVSGWIRRSGPRGVEVVICGDRVPVSVLASVAIKGPKKAQPTSVETHHVLESIANGFEIRG